MYFHGIKVFALPGSDALAENVCLHLNKIVPESLKPDGGIKLIKPHIVQFDNENVMAKIDNVRGHFVVVIHTQAPPVHDSLFSLFALLDAIHNSNAADLLLVFPYMPYARSDRKDQPRISVMSKVLAEILNNVLNVHRIILIDPHDSHVKHYFKPSADEISSIYLYIDFIKDLITNRFEGNTEKLLIAFSDGGSAKRFSKLKEHLPELQHDYIDKIRKDNRGTLQLEKEILCQDKICLMIDDEICSGGTAIKDAISLKKNGAEKIIMLAPHAPLAKVGNTDQEVITNLQDSPIDHYILTDTIPTEEKTAGQDKFHIISVAGLVAQAIHQTIINESVTKLHDPENVLLYRPGQYPDLKL